MLDWCRKCKNRCEEEGSIHTGCLACRWEYVGSEAFSKKSDRFVDDTSVLDAETPQEYWASKKELLAGAEII